MISYNEKQLRKVSRNLSIKNKQEAVLQAIKDENDIIDYVARKGAIIHDSNFKIHECSSSHDIDSNDNKYNSPTHSLRKSISSSISCSFVNKVYEDDKNNSVHVETLIKAIMEEVKQSFF